MHERENERENTTEKEDWRKEEHETHNNELYGELNVMSSGEHKPKFALPVLGRAWAWIHYWILGRA